MDLNDVNTWPKALQIIYAGRFFLIGFLAITLMFTMFQAGARYACDGGYMTGLKCVQPEVLGVYKVCEYNTYGCLKTCALAQLNASDINATLYPADEKV